MSQDNPYVRMKENEAFAFSCTPIGEQVMDFIHYYFQGLPEGQIFFECIDTHVDVLAQDERLSFRIYNDKVIGVTCRGKLEMQYVVVGINNTWVDL